MVVAWRVKREVHQLLVDRNDACRNRAEHAASAGNRSQTPAGVRSGQKLAQALRPVVELVGDARKAGHHFFVMLDRVFPNGLDPCAIAFVQPATHGRGARVDGEYQVLGHSSLLDKAQAQQTLRCELTQMTESTAGRANVRSAPVATLPHASGPVAPMHTQIRDIASSRTQRGP